MGPRKRSRQDQRKLDLVEDLVIKHARIEESGEIPHADVD